MRAFWFLAVIAGLSISRLWAAELDFRAGLVETEATPDQTVRLLGVFPADAPQDLKRYTLLAPEERPLTRHGDLLAHLISPTGAWHQADLVRRGKALVMPVYEQDPERLAALKREETLARLEKAGLWAENPVICADQAARAFDTFALVQGRLGEAARVRGTIYLNFGADYREDFTVKISTQVARNPPEERRNELNRLTEGENLDTVIEARGWVFFSGGPMIEVKTGAQLDILGPGDPRRVKNCLKTPLPGGSG